MVFERKIQLIAGMEQFTDFKYHMRTFDRDKMVAGAFGRARNYGSAFNNIYCCHGN